MDGIPGTLVVLTVGLFVFRPNELPGLARTAGRVVGAGVRGLRRGREAALRATADVSNESSPFSKDTRQRIHESIRAVEALQSRVRREVGTLRLDPRSILLREHEASSPQPVATKTNVLDGSRVTTVARSANISDHPKRKSIASTGSEAGADVVSAVIEEAAFAEQKRRVLKSLGHDNDREPSDKKTSS